ncbi:MAG: hypothetical protein QOE39_2471 [Bradyrhizobium sp.]|jgi:hypothetical protein|nr:hypothetical protein [Bradyrhizobium sp.]
MKWFRSNIKQGSRLALFALAVQFALSFGHFHRVAAQAAPAIQSHLAPSDLSQSIASSAPDAVSQSAQPQQPASDPDSDQKQPNDACAICAVIAMANAVLFAPPLLLLPQAVEFLYLTTDAEFAHLNSARVAFQPRAPPIS